MGPEHLPLSVLKFSDTSISELMTGWPTEAELVQSYTKQVLKHTNENRTRAAQILNINSSTLWRRLGSGKI